MTCEWRGKLDSYVDAELPSPESAELQAHLRVCPACAADALQRLQLKRMTQAAARTAFTPRPEFRLKIENMIGARKKPTWMSAWIPKLSIAAVLIVLSFLSAGLWLQRSQRWRTVGELADLHVATLASANPVDVVSTDRHTVKPWFAGKLPFTFNLPELQGTPFKLVGGRVAYLEQNPGAQLLFDFGKHHISVFIFENRAELARLSSGASTTKTAFNFESWTEGGLRYFAVSDAEPAAIRELRTLLQAAART
jgi:anti-sigma factor RsiW